MAALLCVCALWSVARLAGADRVAVLQTLLAPVLAFTPYAAIVSVLPAVHAAARRRWRTCGVAVAVAAGLTAAVLPRAISDRTPRMPMADGPALRVLTANMHFGRADATQLVGYVRRLHVDVLSLQEFTARGATALDVAGLRAVLPYHVSKAMDGAQGSALYSRHPLRELPMRDLAVVGQAMPRAVLRVPGTAGVEVTSVHMAKPVNPLGAAQWSQGLAGAPPAGGAATVRILAGDFNGTLDNAPVRDLIHAGYVDAADATGAGWAPTFQRSLWPPITIDHVLVDARCAVQRVATYDLGSSDHRALFAEIRLP